MKAKVVLNSPTEGTVFMSDGGVASFYHNGEHMITDYYQDRFNPEERELEEGETMWDVLAEGKMYYNNWEDKQEIDDEMIEDATAWLCINFEVTTEVIREYE